VCGPACSSFFIMRMKKTIIIERVAGCGKTIVARWKFNGSHVEDNRRTPRRMLKRAVQQGRSERRGEGVRFGTLSF